MRQRDKFESALVKAKANWRRVCDSSNSTASDRLRARVIWKKAQISRDKAHAIWRQALAERRRANADRRQANADRRRATAENARARVQAERRKTIRRP